MKTALIIALLAGCSAAPAIYGQVFQSQPSRVERLILIPGPYLLSPAGATGEVAPGQRWNVPQRARPTTPFSLRSPKETAPFIGELPIGLRSSLQEGTLTLKSADFGPLEGATVLRIQNHTTLPELTLKLSRTN